MRERPHPLQSLYANLRHVVLPCLGALVALAIATGSARAQTPVETEHGAEADVFVARAIVAYEDGRYDEALAALDQALQLDPKNVDAFYYRGLVRLAQGQLDQGIAALEQARQLSPTDDAILFQLGVAYFTGQKYDQAQPLLEQVFAKKPQLDGLGYYVGLMRYRRQDYQGALRAFRAGTTTNRDLAQLTRFYAGLALGILGLPERAAAEIEEALRLQPASPLTGPAERLREAVVTSREREQRLRAEIRFGFLFDDNVSVNPDDKPSDALVASLRKRRQTSFGELGGARVDYSLLRLGSFETTGTASLFIVYNNDIPKFNIVDLLAGLGETYRGTVGAMPYQLALQWTYDYVALDTKEFVQRHTISPFATLIENGSNLSAVQFRYQDKEFAHDTNIPREEKRDGKNWMAGATHIFRLEGDKHLLKLGYQWDFDDTLGPTSRGRDYAYTGNRVLAGAQYSLPWQGARLKYDFDVHIRDYKHKNVVLPVAAPGTKARFDTEFTHMLGFTVPLPQAYAPAQKPLTLSVDYQMSDARSNLAVFEFHRNVASVSLIWSY